MWVTGGIFTLLAICFMLAIYFTKLILDYLDSKPYGRKTLMDELNKVSLYSYLLVILSNYPLAMVLTLGLDLSQFKYVAAFLSINRYGKIKPKKLKF